MAEDVLDILAGVQNNFELPNFFKRGRSVPKATCVCFLETGIDRGWRCG
jgi:hypothetical protein